MEAFRVKQSDKKWKSHKCIVCFLFVNYSSYTKHNILLPTARNKRLMFWLLFEFSSGTDPATCVIKDEFLPNACQHHLLDF